MSTITFVTWAGGGNVPPTLAVAAELVERGHTVEVMGHDSIAAAAARAGVSFVGFDRARGWDAAQPAGAVPMLRMLGGRSLGTEVLAHVRTRPVDLLVVDCLLFGVMQTLRNEGIPYVAFEHLCDGYLRRATRGPLGLALRLGGVRALDLVNAAEVRIAMTVPELDRGHGDVIHVGPAIDAVPRSASEPAVLISLSTYPFPGLTDRWQRMLAAVDGLAARVVATTGPHIDPATLRVPAGVEIHRWLDHAAVLPEMSLVIGHGGHGTTIAALAHGLPVAVSPLDPKTDQPYMGDSVAALGVGRRLGTRAKPAAIRAVLDELLALGPHREAADRLGATIRGYNGRRGGADVIESVLHPSDGGRESC